MTKLRTSTLFCFLFVFNYFILQTYAQFPFFPRPLRPRSRPSIPGYHPEPDARRQYHRLPLEHNAVGPESTTFDCRGESPYVGVSDGRVLKWEGSSRGWTVFATSNPYRSTSCDGMNDSPIEQYCGRPLGLKFNMATCELYIADSSFGLLKVGRKGGVATPVATGAEGAPFRFLNALDIDSESGEVYFTDSSIHHHRWEYKAIDVNDRSGRLLRYDPRTRRVVVLLKGLTFANGVALSKNKDFVLVTETTAHQVQRYWLAGSKVDTSELFIQLSGSPDNINRNADGDFWIAQNPTSPIKVSEVGTILESLDANQIEDTSDVNEFNNTLWVASVIQPYLLYTR